MEIDITQRDYLFLRFAIGNSCLTSKDLDPILEAKMRGLLYLLKDCVENGTTLHINPVKA